MSYATHILDDPDTPTAAKTYSQIIAAAVAAVDGLQEIDIDTIAELNAILTDGNVVSQTRTITAGTGLSGGGDLSDDRTLTLADTAVTAGSYTGADLTVDAQGRITAAASGPWNYATANVISTTRGIRPGVFDTADSPPVRTIVEDVTDGHLYWVHSDGSLHVLCSGSEYGAGGGSTAWGDITGTLSTQTDLAAALAGKSAVGHSHTLSDVSDSGALAGLNTVGTLEIEDAAVTTDKLADGSVTAAKLASHTHNAADITGGTFDDARISQSSVTQHQAALSITESQISDLGPYLTTGDLSGYLQATDIASGTITPRSGAVDLSGGSDGDVLTVQADGSLAIETPTGGGGSPGEFRAVSGHYYPACNVRNAISLVTHSADTLYLYPFRFGAQETWTKIWLYCQTTGSSNARLGIYVPDDLGDGLSTADFTLLTDAGVVTNAATGAREITGISQTISSGQIVTLAVLADASFASLGVPAANGLFDLLLGGATGAPQLSPNNAFTKALTYGALPSAIAGATPMALNFPLIGLRL